ncbi:hypothetical protein GJN52_19085 [Salmonella enterica subsp. enterica]|nr:hypothetical protein [Salmonella enterica subsp. enterica serovar Emek]
MNEFHRWKGEKLKEKNRMRGHAKHQLLIILTSVMSLLAIGELLFVVWVMSGK